MKLHAAISLTRIRFSASQRQDSCSAHPQTSTNPLEVAIFRTAGQASLCQLQVDSPSPTTCSLVRPPTRCETRKRILLRSPFGGCHSACDLWPTDQYVSIRRLTRARSCSPAMMHPACVQRNTEPVFLGALQVDMCYGCEGLALS